MSRQRINPNVNPDGTARTEPFRTRNDAARGPASDEDVTAAVDEALAALERYAASPGDGNPER